MFGKLLQLFHSKCIKSVWPAGGGYIASPDPLAGFKVASSRHEMIRKTGQARDKGKERGGISPTTNSWICHCEHVQTSGTFRRAFTNYAT